MLGAVGEGAGEERQPENWFSSAATHYNTQFNVVVQALLTNSVEEHHKQKGTTRHVFLLNISTSDIL